MPRPIKIVPKVPVTQTVAIQIVCPGPDPVVLSFATKSKRHVEIAGNFVVKSVEPNTSYMVLLFMAGPKCQLLGRYLDDVSV